MRAEVIRRLLSVEPKKLGKVVPQNVISLGKKTVLLVLDLVLGHTS